MKAVVQAVSVTAIYTSCSTGSGLICRCDCRATLRHRDIQVGNMSKICKEAAEFCYIPWLPHLNSKHYLLIILAFEEHLAAT
jgi:hypothetical protein